MRIYVDFDDVICETAKCFTRVAKELFDINVPYSQFQFFDLQITFDIDQDQYHELMRVCHLPENLLSYEETPGASETMNRWVDEGHEVLIITGRPLDAYEPSRKWLDAHGLERIPLFCVDKYGREKNKQKYSYSMTLQQLYETPFDFAIEDSPDAFEHVMHFDRCRIAVFQRPWNQNVELPNDQFIRCSNWEEIDQIMRIIEQN